MKVTKAQSQENRAHIVETASALFRERGFDGIGIAELMAEAGFTHGGFYKHFGSKADLMTESAAYGIAQSLATHSEFSLSEFITHYVSREHRDSRANGCTMAALGGDASRQSETIKLTFETGIEQMLAMLQVGIDIDQRRTFLLSTFAHAVGALVLSRACQDDAPLADEILMVCRDDILTQLELRKAQAEA